MNQSAIENSGLTKYGEKFLLGQAKSLLAFARGSAIDDNGFGYLDSQGIVDSNKPRQAYVQCRMIQVFGLAHVMGLSDTKKQVKHGVDSLNNQFFDGKYGGFFNAIDASGKSIGNSKLGYDHMFVLLAATTAKAVGVDGSDLLLARAEEVIDSFFWDSEFQMMKDQWDASFTKLDTYRGINVNMHAVEALTAAFDMTGDKKYLNRALAICKRAVDGFARAHKWLLPEHFTSGWIVEREFNREHPADQFRPYGITIGHLFEWSRLILQLGLHVKDQPEYDWIQEAAKNLYLVAKEYGWSADGTLGFIYTMDWEKRPVIRARMHWVAAEAVMAAYVLWKITGEREYLVDYDVWWSYIDTYMIDREFGSWHHELNPQHQRVEETWPGKPDVYHAFNACLLPLLPFEPSFIGSASKLIH